MAFSYVALALEMLHVYLLEKGWVWLYSHMGAARLTNYLGLKVQSQHTATADVQVRDQLEQPGGCFWLVFLAFL